MKKFFAIIIVSLLTLTAFTSCNINYDYDTTENLSSEEQKTDATAPEETELSLSGDWCQVIPVIVPPPHTTCFDITWESPKEATCTTDGLRIGWCRSCWKKQEEVIPAGHTIDVYDAKEPTCTEVGWEDYEACSKCDYTTYKEIPAVAHDYTQGDCLYCGDDNPNII